MSEDLARNARRRSLTATSIAVGLALASLVGCKIDDAYAATASDADATTKAATTRPVDAGGVRCPPSADCDWFFTAESISHVIAGAPHFYRGKSAGDVCVISSSLVHDRVASPCPDGLACLEFLPGGYGECRPVIDKYEPSRMPAAVGVGRNDKGDGSLVVALTPPSDRAVVHVDDPESDVADFPPPKSHGGQVLVGTFTTLSTFDDAGSGTRLGIPDEGTATLGEACAPLRQRQCVPGLVCVISGFRGGLDFARCQKPGPHCDRTHACASGTRCFWGDTLWYGPKTDWSVGLARWDAGALPEGSRCQKDDWSAAAPDAGAGRK